MYRQVMELQPNNALAMNNVAWLLVKQGKPGATALAEKATSILGDRAPLLDTLASALAADNQIAKAIEVQKRAVSLAPESPALRLALAKHYVKAGEKSLAKTELESLKKLGEKFREQAEVTELLKTL
jgi:Flp pilus assembly protein TadD